MSATFTKLNDGSWGLRVTGSVKAGDTVSVTKKSGETESKVVGKVLWSGNGVSICTIAREGESSYNPRGGMVSRRVNNAPCLCDDPCNNWCPRCDGPRRKFYR